MTSNDPSIVNLQENLAQAQLTIEHLEIETVPQQNTRNYRGNFGT